MKCFNCQAVIPAQSRFCLNCGAAQPVATPEVVAAPRRTVPSGAADSGPATPVAPPAENPVENPNEAEEFSWLNREAVLDPNFDYEAQRQYDGAVGRAIGCLGIFFFAFIGLLLLIPGVPILAITGLPLALVLGPLTYFNVGRLQERVRSVNALRKLPGFASPKAAVLAVSVSGYLALVSVLCIGLMILTRR